MTSNFHPNFITFPPPRTNPTIDPSSTIHIQHAAMSQPHPQHDDMPDTLRFEQDFHEWKERISKSFVARGRPTQAYPAISHIDNGTTVYHKSTLRDIDHVTHHISEKLCSRLPLDTKATVGSLYANLERLCQPFRLLDLPPELRNYVYEEVVSSQRPQIIHSYWWISTASLPALAQASRQLRNEVLPTYFSANIFLADDTFHACEPYDLRLKVRTWETQILRSSAKFLRRLDLLLHAEKSSRFLCFTDDKEVLVTLTSSKDNGLTLTTSARFKLESQKMLDDAISQAEAQRKAQRLEGESILLALDNLDKMKSSQVVDRWLDVRLQECEVSSN